MWASVIADEHADDVFDGEEAQPGYFHGGAEIRHRLARERAEDEIEQQPQEELDIQRDDEQSDGAIVGWRPRPRPRQPARRRVQRPAMMTAHRSHE